MDMASVSAVCGDLLGQILHDGVQRFFEHCALLIFILQHRVAGLSVGQHDAHVIGGRVAVHADPVERDLCIAVQQLLQQLRAHGTVSRDEREHGAHVGMDHA